MNEALRNLSYQELLDRLAALTARLSEGRGFDKGHEFCKIDIEEIQAEIESRKRAQETEAVQRG
jgi:hypothetical protein